MTDFKLGESVFSIIVGSIITTYSVYTNLKKEIHDNNIQIELTIISMLKSQIKYLEGNPCKTSRSDWAEYNMLLSQYYFLVKKNNPSLEGINIKPIDRLLKDSCKCYKGIGECYE